MIQKQKHTLTLKFDITKKQYFEKYDVYSAAIFILKFLSNKMSGPLVKILEESLYPFFNEDLDKRPGIDELYQKFNDKGFVNHLFGEVDEFWEKHIETLMQEDPFTLVHRIPYQKFMNAFVAHFNHPDHPDVVPYINTKVSEDRRIEEKYLLKSVKDIPNISNRQTVSFRLFLNCIESYSTNCSRRKFYVTREGYSKAFGLIKTVMYDSKGPRDYWTILQKIKDLTLDQRYWFGIVSDEVAKTHLSRIQMSKIGVISYIVYGSGEDRGVWKILYKFPKDPNFYSFNSQLRSRIHNSRDFTNNEFLDIHHLIQEDINNICKEYCRNGRWTVPSDEQMKISFHTPGALCYLKESKTAYVKSNETPKDMMRRIKLEAKKDKDSEKDRTEESQLKGEDEEIKEDLSTHPPVTDNNDISLN